MKVRLYGIPNCDTVKAARRWLDAQPLAYSFHDFKKHGITADDLERWAKAVDWEFLLNRRGTTWRKLSDADRNDMNKDKALQLMQQHTSLIKRPVLEIDDAHIVVGFDEQEWKQLLL